MTTYLEGCVTLCVEALYFNSPHCGSRDIVYFIESCDFMEGGSSLYVTILPCLVAVVIAVLEI